MLASRTSIPRDSRPLQPLRHDIGPDDAIPTVLGDTRGHVANRPQSNDQHAAAGWNRGVFDGLPGRRQHIREVDEPVVRRIRLRHLDVGVLRLGHAQVLGLPTRNLAVEFGVAKERRPHAVFPDLGGLALGLEILVAHETVAAGDLEGNHHAVAALEAVTPAPTSSTIPIGS